jgi:hypothetical protein
MPALAPSSLDQWVTSFLLPTVETNSHCTKSLPAVPQTSEAISSVALDSGIVNEDRSSGCSNDCANDFPADSQARGNPIATSAVLQGDRFKVCAKHRRFFHDAQSFACLNNPL